MVTMRLNIIILILALAITSCNTNNSTLNCTEIEETIMPREQIVGANLDNIYTHLTSTYQIQTEDIQVYEYPSLEISTLLTWEYKNQEYTASFSEKRLRRVALRFQNNSITLGNVLECFPKPRYYYYTLSEHAESWRYDLQLWYPDLQMVVSTIEFQNEPTWTTPHKDIIITDVFWIQGSSIEDIAETLYLNADADLISQEVLPIIHPWPGALNLLRLEQNFKAE
jgi:hypothetical protein